VLIEPEVKRSKGVLAVGGCAGGMYFDISRCFFVNLKKRFDGLLFMQLQHGSGCYSCHDTCCCLSRRYAGASVLIFLRIC